MNTAANTKRPPEPERRETQAERFERIYKVIRERISVLEYGPGTVLNEGLLSEEFDVSRTPIRSVLQRLNYEGLVTTRNGIGTIVTEVDVKTFKDIYALRMRLAEDLGVLSPILPTREMIDKLDDLLARARKLREGPPDYKAYARLCNAVHEQQLELTENKILAEINDLLYYRAARIWLAFLPNIDWEEAMKILENEIADTARALEMGDMQGVGNVRRQHLYIILKTIGRYLVGV
ncbi:MAG: GntR family transcriptional regulator [Hyphomicrobiales bacterium]|nr:GntR family transcriptional regulator [Hyphomicrobiales bacterium]MCP5076421.1 GntR family transcriptional regulator [Paracoccaceae bacterium]